MKTTSPFSDNKTRGLHSNKVYSKETQPRITKVSSSGGRQEVKGKGTDAWVIMCEEGVILTCSRVVPKKIVLVQFSFEHNREESFDTNVHHRNANLDLTILLP